MKTRTVYIIVSLGIVVIALTFYLFYAWMTKAYNQQEKKFGQSVQIALIEVVKKLSVNRSNELPQFNPVKKIAPDYYVVDIENKIECDILEFYLKNEFEKMAILTDFEYGIYDCFSERMIYGNYVSYKNNHTNYKTSFDFPKQNGLVYYFVIRFPRYTHYTISSIKFLTGFSILSLLFLIFIAYTIAVILYQMRFSQQQKDFINNMTHEFKTPISSVLLAAERISCEAVIKENDILIKYVDIIRDQNRRLNTLVERVLQIANAERRTYKLTLNKIQLNEILSSIIDTIRKEHPKGIFKIESANNDVEVFADEIHFINVIHTILDNSIKYSNQNPEIVIHTREVSNQFVLLSISDKGIGLEKKYHKKVFQKFFRVPTGDVHDVKGYGLGLYYVKKISKKHGWKIGLESEKGKGTKINLLLRKVS